MMEVCKEWVKGPLPESAPTTRLRRKRPFIGLAPEPRNPTHKRHSWPPQRSMRCQAICLRADSGSSAFRMVVQPLCLARCQAHARQEKLAVLRVSQIAGVRDHDRGDGAQPLDDLLRVTE